MFELQKDVLVASLASDSYLHTGTPAVFPRRLKLGTDAVTGNRNAVVPSATTDKCKRSGSATASYMKGTRNQLSRNANKKVDYRKLHLGTASKMSTTTTVVPDTEDGNTQESEGGVFNGFPAQGATGGLTESYTGDGVTEKFLARQSTGSANSDEEFGQHKHVVQDPDIDKKGELQVTEIFRPTQFRAARNRLGQTAREVEVKFRELNRYFTLKAKEMAEIRKDLDEHKIRLENDGMTEIVPNEVESLTKIIKQKYRSAKKHYNVFKKTDEGKESLKKELILTQMKKISRDANESQVLVDIMCTQLQIESTWNTEPSEVTTVQNRDKVIHIDDELEDETDTRTKIRPPASMLSLSSRGST
jgi:hypothetical protein